MTPPMSMGGGLSERLIGRWLGEDKPQDVFVATKLGRGNPGWPKNFTLETMRTHTEESLGRLGVPALDLIQLHCVPTEKPCASGEIFENLRTLQAEGKIRRWGASVESMEEAHLLPGAADGLSSLQIIFNLFRQKPIDDLFADALAKGVGIIVRLPLASGLLAESTPRRQRSRRRTTVPTTRDGQAFNVGETFAGLPFEKGVALADALKPLVPEGFTLPEMALRWCLDFPAVSVLIPGAKNPAQAHGNAHVSDLPPLSPALHQTLRRFYEEQGIADAIRGPY